MKLSLGQPRDLAGYNHMSLTRWSISKGLVMEGDGIILSYLSLSYHINRKTFGQRVGFHLSWFFMSSRLYHPTATTFEVCSFSVVTRSTRFRNSAYPVKDIKAERLGHERNWFPNHVTRQGSWIWIWGALSNPHSWSCLASSSRLPSFHLWCIHSGTLQVPFFFLSHKRWTLRWTFPT